MSMVLTKLHIVRQISEKNNNKCDAYHTGGRIIQL